MVGILVVESARGVGGAVRPVAATLGMGSLLLITAGTSEQSLGQRGTHGYLTASGEVQVETAAF